MAKKISKSKKEQEDRPVNTTKLIAKKDFTICFNEYSRKIEAGEEIGDVPEIFHQNLKTEGVI